MAMPLNDLERMRYLVSCLLICCSVPAMAQLSLKGTVRDQDTRQPLPQANVQLLQDKIKKLTATDNEGNFTLSGLKSGNYNLVVHYLSYNDDTLRFNLKKDSAVIVDMRSSNRQLAEVVIKTDIPPVSVRSDTISFNTQAYKTRANAPVEELLRKLPGISVDADGNVTMQGKPVDKILIDGKAFFIDDLRKATRNLPADIVSQVEIFDSSTPGQQLNGERPSGQQKTINIKLKKNKKKGLIAKLYAGSGTNGVYAAGGNLTLLSGKQFLNVNLAANNLADQFNGTENNFALLQPGKQTLWHSDLNYHAQLSDKLNLDIFGGAHHSRITTASSDDRSTYFADSTLLSHTQSQTLTTNSDYSAGGRLEYRPDKQTYLVYDLHYQYNTDKDLLTDSATLHSQRQGFDSLISKGYTNNSTNNHGYTLTQAVGFNRRLSDKGRAISFNASINDNNLTTDRQLYSLTSTSQTDELQNAPASSRSYHIDARYAEPIGEHTRLSISYSWDNNPGHTAQNAFLRNPLTGLYDLVDTANTLIYDSRISTQRYRLGIGSHSEQKFFYDAGLAEQISGQASNGLQTRYDNFSPDVRLGYKPAEGQYLNFYYTGNAQNPDIRQLAPLPDLSNPYLIQEGNTHLRQAFINHASLDYSAFNQTRLDNLMIGISGDYGQHPIGLSTTTLPGGIQQQQYVNLQDNYHVNLFANYGWAAFGAGHGNANIGPVASLGHDETLLNGAPSFTQTTSAGLNTKFNYQLGSKLLLDFDANINRQTNHYSLAAQPGTNSYQQNYTLEANYNLPANFLIGGHYLLQVNNTSNLPATHSQLLNLWLGKDVLADHSLQARVSGFNLLNNASSIMQTAGQNYLDVSTQEVTHRLFLFSLVYNFRKFNTNNENVIQ